MTPELFVKNSICSYLSLFKSLDFWIVDSVGIYDQKIGKFRANCSPFRRKGISDIMGVFSPHGRILAIEVKAGKNKATTEQLAFIEMINQRGGIAFVARSIDDAKKHLDHLRGEEVDGGQARKSF